MGCWDDTPITVCKQQLISVCRGRGKRWGWGDGGVQRRGLWCWGLKCGSWWFLKDELLYVGVGNTSSSWSESTICCYWLILTGIKDILPVFLQLAIPLQYLQVGHNRKTLLAEESEPQPQHHGGGKGGGEDGHQSEREKIYNCRPGY